MPLTEGMVRIGEPLDEAAAENPVVGVPAGRCGGVGDRPCGAGEGIDAGAHHARGDVGGDKPAGDGREMAGEESGAGAKFEGRAVDAFRQPLGEPCRGFALDGGVL